MSELSATDIHAHYGHGRRRVHALRGVTASITPDRSLGLAGESGSGKSTFARVLVGLIRPTQGTVLWDGRPLASLPRRGEGSRSKVVQMVFQDPGSSLNQRMTVFEMLNEALDTHEIPGERRAEVGRLLRMVDLAPTDASKFPFQFSGGQRQRIALARALAVRPQVLVCDEMTSALDVSVQAAILNLIRRVRTETGLTLVVVSHNLDVIRYLCDEVCIMKDGTVIERGSTSALMAEPQHEYTKALLDAVPRFAITPGSLARQG